MNVQSIEMSIAERNRLRGLMDSEDFALLLVAVEAREAELRVSAAEALGDSMSVGSYSPEALPVDVQGRIVAALRWKAAREVLAELAGPKFYPAREVRITAT